MIDITTRIKSGAYVSGKAIGIYGKTSMRIRDRSYLNHEVLSCTETWTKNSVALAKS